MTRASPTARRSTPTAAHRREQRRPWRRCLDVVAQSKMEQGGKEGPGCRHIAQGHFILHGRRTPDLPPPAAAPLAPPTPIATQSSKRRGARTRATRPNPSY